MLSLFTRLNSGEDKPPQETLPVQARAPWRSRLRRILMHPFSRNRSSDPEQPGVPRNLPAA
jgi:hypothetical protein